MATTASDSRLGSRPEAPGDASPGDATPRKERRARLRSALRAAGVVLLALALGYGAGRGHGSFYARVQERELEAALDAQRRASLREGERQALAVEQAEALVAKTQLERNQLSEAVTLYEAYHRMQQALTQLDARNFGIAQAKLRETERLLASSATNVTWTRSIADRLSATNVTVAGNLGDQRKTLGALIDEFDRLLELYLAPLATRESAAAGAPEASEATEPSVEPAPANEVR